VDIIDELAVIRERVPDVSTPEVAIEYEPDEMFIDDGV
jgi:hypothetical protein